MLCRAAIPASHRNCSIHKTRGGPVVMKKRTGRPLVSLTACRFVFMSAGSSKDRPGRIFSNAGWKPCPSYTCFTCAVRQWMCLEVRCIDRDGPVTRCLFGARPIMILANTPMSLQRFQRSYRIFCGQYAAGASHRRRRGGLSVTPKYFLR